MGWSRAWRLAPPVALRCWARVPDRRLGEPGGERPAAEVLGRVPAPRAGAAPPPTGHHRRALQRVCLRPALLHRLCPLQPLHAGSGQDQRHELVGACPQHRCGAGHPWPQGGVWPSASHPYGEGCLQALRPPLPRASRTGLVTRGWTSCPTWPSSPPLWSPLAEPHQLPGREREGHPSCHGLSSLPFYHSVAHGPLPHLKQARAALKPASCATGPGTPSSLPLGGSGCWRWDGDRRGRGKQLGPSITQDPEAGEGAMYSLHPPHFLCSWRCWEGCPKLSEDSV